MANRHSTDAYIEKIYYLAFHTDAFNTARITIDIECVVPDERWQSLQWHA